MRTPRDIRRHTRARASGRAPWYFLWLGAVAVLAGAGTFLAVYAATQSALYVGIHELLRDPAAVDLVPTVALVLVVLAPASAAVLGWFLAWEAVRLIHLAGYMRRLHRLADAYLRQHAPLSRLGYVEAALPFEPDGGASPHGEQPLAALLSKHRGILVLGDRGVGKTVALYRTAFDLSSARQLFPVAFGHTPLPVLVPLGAYADSPAALGGPRIDFLARQVRALGHPRLAARSSSALHRWNVLLLCDGLDEVSLEARTEVAAELAQLATEAYPSAHLAVTCALPAYLALPDQLASLHALARAVITGVSAAELQRMLRLAQRTLHISREGGEELPAQVARAGLGAQAGHPATLAALLRVKEAGLPLPAGRSRILAAYARLLCRRVVGTDEEAERLALVLARLANALRLAGVSYLRLELGETPGEALVRWLQEPFLAPRLGQALPSAEVTAEEADVWVVASLNAGMLERLPDASGLCFANPSLEAMFAGLSLERADDDTGRLSPTLVEPTWWEPVLLWAGISEHAGHLAKRLQRLAQAGSTPVGQLEYAGDQDSPAMRAVTPLALALAALLEALAPLVAQDTPAGNSSTASVELLEEHLRDLLDDVEISLAQPEQRALLTTQLGAIERETLVDFAAHLATLAQASRVRRLVRAQAIALLGSLATPVALDALVSMLTEPDPVLREAVDRALAAAGPAGAASLLQALSHPDEHVRTRATEALSRGGPSAADVALDGLEARAAPVRAAAARALGALRASGATDALIARLDDTDASVRIAAADALGQVGTADVVPRVQPYLSSGSADLRAALATALGSIRERSALPVLLSLLTDPDARVRAATAEALGKLGDERAVRSLRDRLADADPLAQAAVATALRRLRSQ